MVGFDKKLYTFTEHHTKSLLTYDEKNRALYTKKDHMKLLLTASLVNGFAEGVSRSLNNSPTGETLLSYIKGQEQEELHQAFDRLIEQNIKTIRKRRKLTNPVPIAIDWHDVMYYGDPKTSMVMGTNHKKGSNYAYEYLTASVLVDGERLVLAVLPITARNEVSDLTISVLLRIHQLGIKIRYVTFDGGFFNVDTIRFLEAWNLKYILHLPMTRKAKRMKLWKGRRFVYTGRKREWKRILSFCVVVAYDERKKYKYLLATNMHYSDDTLLHLFNKRWGIETSYRMCNQFLVRTTSRAYVTRLFYYLFACIVYNAWVLFNEDEACTVIQMKICLIGYVTNELRESPT
jgi:hypothetical protein